MTLVSKVGSWEHPARFNGKGDWGLILPLNSEQILDQT